MLISIRRRFHKTAGPGANILVVASSVHEHFNELLITVVCVKWMCVCVCVYVCMFVDLSIQFSFLQHSVNHVTIPSAPGAEPTECLGSDCFQQRHNHKSSREG